MKKLAAFALTLSLAAASLTGCASGGAATSAQATAENPMVLTLAHGLSETHTVHIAMTEFAEKVEEGTDGRIQIRILPNGQLGSENENMEQLMAGVISMTKVSAPGLATYNEAYHTFGLPYIFDDTENFYHVMDSQPMRDFFLSTADDGFVTLTYYTSGARSFYTINKPIRTPEDLKGLKIRVQDMKSQTDMMKALGGIPVAMSYGDVYTSLQTGIIDGTENNETALTTGKHGEICKVYSTDQHAMIPDVMVMSAKVWKTISPQDQNIILEAARESTESHKIAWDAAIDEAIREAESYPGPAIVIAYCPCLEHGIKAGMSCTQEEMKKAVECGYWHLYRYDPRRIAEGKNPFQLDSPAPDSGKMMDYLKGENRYASLQINFPDRAQRLYEKTVQDAKDRYAKYRKMAED